ncbi:MAG: gephyrin-like molybdotransferase Glp [Nitrospinota bacterium]
MLDIYKALEIIHTHIVPSLEYEDVPLLNSTNRILASDAISDITMPPFNRAMMDGYALRSADSGDSYEVIEYIPAGYSPTLAVGPMQASKIMTGAPLPEGADAIVPVEKSSGYVEVGAKVVIEGDVSKGSNIAKAGEDFKKGEVLLNRLSHLTAPKIGLLASIGYDPVSVIKRPSVAILSTGDELVEPSTKPVGGQIRNSTAHPLYARILELGCDPLILGSASDNIADIREKLRSAHMSDFILITGGVSAGDKDFVAELVEDEKFEILFHKIKIKPGKPTLFAIKDKKQYLFGLPGNPVSSLVIFELYVRAAINRFLGASKLKWNFIESKLEFNYSRRNSIRNEFLPVSLKFQDSNLIAKKVNYCSSADIKGLAMANGLILIPSGIDKINKGTLVKTLLTYSKQ